MQSNSASCTIRNYARCNLMLNTSRELAAFPLQEWCLGAHDQQASRQDSRMCSFGKSLSAQRPLPSCNDSARTPRAFVISIRESALHCKRWTTTALVLFWAIPLERLDSPLRNPRTAVRVLHPLCTRTAYTFNARIRRIFLFLEGVKCNSSLIKRTQKP